MGESSLKSSRPCSRNGAAVGKGLDASDEAKVYPRVWDIWRADDITDVPLNVPYLGGLLRAHGASRCGSL